MTSDTMLNLLNKMQFEERFFSNGIPISLHEMTGLTCLLNAHSPTLFESSREILEKPIFQKPSDEAYEEAFHEVWRLVKTATNDQEKYNFNEILRYLTKRYKLWKKTTTLAHDFPPYYRPFKTGEISRKAVL